MLRWPMLPLIALAAGHLQQAAAPVAIVKTEITRDQSSRQVMVEIENRTNVAVTAWKLSFLLHHPNGSTQRLATGADAYLAYEAVVPDRDIPMVIQPYARTSWSEPLDVRPADIAAVEVTLEYAVFADTTWIGDPSTVDDCFRSRQAEYDSVTDILAVLKDARDTGPGTDALRRALQLLERDPENGRKEMVRRNLREALRTGVPAPDALLRHQIASYELRLHAAEQHRRRGAQRPR